jgi:hypothetical protein
MITLFSGLIVLALLVLIMFIAPVLILAVLALVVLNAFAAIYAGIIS